MARRERLRKLALETVDLRNDPYLTKNQLGGYECRLCLTLHSSESSYLAHTQGKKHQVNIAQRAALQVEQQTEPSATQKQTFKHFKKIGLPGYRVTRVREDDTSLKGLLFEVDLPMIKDGIRPVYRIMSAYEQKVDVPDINYQYLVIAAEPYQSIAFKIPNMEVLTEGFNAFETWDISTKRFALQVFLKERSATALPVIQQRPVISI